MSPASDGTWVGDAESAACFLNEPNIREITVNAVDHPLPEGIKVLDVEGGVVGKVVPNSLLVHILHVVPNLPVKRNDPY